VERLYSTLAEIGEYRETHRLIISLDQLSNLGVAIFGSLHDQSEDEQTVVVGESERIVICMAHRGDFSLQMLKMKLGIECCIETCWYRGYVEWPLRCECVDPEYPESSLLLKIYRGEWPSELVSLNQGCYIEGDKCRACYSMNGPEGASLITFDPGIVFMLERKRILVVSEERSILPEVSELKKDYLALQVLKFEKIEKLLSEYLDMYLGYQVRVFMNRITEGGLLLKPEVARAIRRGPTVVDGRFILEKMTFYTSLTPQAIQSLIISVEEIEGVIISLTNLRKAEVGSGCEGQFGWTVYGLGPYTFRRRNAHRSSHSVVYHHGRIIQQWIRSNIRPISELYSSVGIGGR